jgi:23S rRNA-/tRNA-specific pseudouridylate synthase
LKDSESRKVKAYFKEVKGSKLAKTEYRYLRQESSYSLVEVTLHTGRKNQIRVHLSDIGCPIVGDRKYGAQATPVRQIRLAAYYIDMTHPVSGKRLEMKYQPDERFFKPSKKEDEHYK